MSVATETPSDSYSTFVVKNEEFVVVPKKEFRRLQKLDESPKMYTEEDEQGVWETIDFGLEGIDPQELISHLRT